MIAKLDAPTSPAPMPTPAEVEAAGARIAPNLGDAGLCAMLGDRAIWAIELDEEAGVAYIVTVPAPMYPIADEMTAKYIRRRSELILTALNAELGTRIDRSIIKLRTPADRMAHLHWYLARIFGG